MSERSLLADVRPLRESPEFRRLWAGYTLSQVGGQMTTFAVSLQVYRITGSSVAVGAVGLALAIPLIIVGLLGGTLIDSVDRRRLVLITTVLAAMLSVIFAVQAFAELDELWLLYLLVALQAVVGAIGGPARRTFAPRLLRRELIPSAAALTMVSMYISGISDPALAGLLTAAGGLKTCYVVDAVSFGAALYGVSRLPSMRPEGEAVKRNLASVVAGLRFLVTNVPLRGALLADMSATILAMPIALFPAINADRFGGSPRTLGLLGTAVAVGGLAGSVLSGPVKHVLRPGRAMLIAASVWGVALAGFGLVQALAPTLVLLAVAGSADVLAVVFRTSIVQLATPDSMRGRTSSAEMVVGAGFPQLGNFRAGLVASASSPGVSAFSGGLSAVAGAGLIALLLPTFVRYRHVDTDAGSVAPPEGAQHSPRPTRAADPPASR